MKPHQLMAALVGALVAGCDTGTSAPLSPAPYPECALTNPVEAGISGLSLTSATRDRCQVPTAYENDLCTSKDAQNSLASMPFTSVYQDLVNTLVNHASIGGNVVRVVPDLMSLKPAGGGVTGHLIVVMDGKFFDILTEYTNYLAAHDTGLTTTGRVPAVNAIVASHNSIRGGAAPQSLFPTAALDSYARKRARHYLLDYAGAILAHEFGHFWAWGCVDQLRMQSASANGFYIYPAMVENDADFITGALTAKSGHDLTRAQEMIDLMAYYALQRQSPSASILDIEVSYDQQFRQQYPTYESLAGRKQLIAQGYNAYVASGRYSRPQDPLPPVSPPAETFTCNGKTYSCASVTGVAGCCQLTGDAVQCPKDKPRFCTFGGYCTADANCGNPPFASCVLPYCG
ncbi:hypothetical protein [Corallococcus sp. AS-1-12]|uniref:hypothetical protein n=1 Tax=Corallococcus sp. AS-1-12 TaxID=2874598 RepID=UPI001CBFFE3C|nr:hypothetical protein [Corallococcus sp. AS-1-12]MBZ4333521.1 hypothetical protein [Corallococcus sp. AS-1-12]